MNENFEIVPEAKPAGPCSEYLSVKPTLDRESSGNVLQVPTSAGTLMITAVWARSFTGSRFFLENDGCLGFVAFVTKQILQLITETSIIITDGIFNACHCPFEQPYVVFETFDERKFPLNFSSLEGKTAHHYKRLFQIIKQKIDRKFNSFHWVPEKLVSGFETGLIPAVQTEFPNLIHWGCYYLFTQAIFGKIQNLGHQNHLR